MTTATVKLPPKIAKTFGAPRGSVQYRALHGGRGSGKSYGAAKVAAIWGLVDPIRVLCAREFQASIKESFHAELKAAIASEPWLEAHYDVGVDYLRGRNGTEFIFRGLRHNIGSIKSLAKIDLTIVEEAEDVPEAAWLGLEATVFRQPNAELWPIWNPRLDGSPVDNRFRKSPPDNAIVAEVNWNDNPFFPVGLNKLRLREQSRLDPSTYAHIWEGAYLTNSDSQVFAGKYEIAEFEPQPSWDGPYQGGDFGYSQDPTAAVRLWIKDEVLYCEHEAGSTGINLDDTAPFIDARIPQFDQHTTRWDSAQPGNINFLQRHGHPLAVGVKKWPGSVVDGVSFMRAFRKIVIHPRCAGVAQEFRLYSYKVDRNSGDIMPVIVDAHNHYIDAMRYALAPMIRSTEEGFFVL
jgi:phage terminase large subunit